MYESFDDYLKYMQAHREKIPAHVYDFATDVSRHDIESPNSLHDSWITSITIKENRNKKQPFSPRTTIEIEFLGQMHDRNIFLKYEDIESYAFEGIKNPYNYGDTYHGDVACHEVRVTEGGLLMHEILLASEAKIKIVCKNITCTEQVST